MNRVRAKIDALSVVPHPRNLREEPILASVQDGAFPTECASTLVRTLVDRSTQAAFALDAEGRLVHANDLFEAVVGRARATVLGRAFVDALVPSELAVHVRRSLGRAFAGELVSVVATVAQEGGAWIELVTDALLLDNGPCTLFLTVRSARLARAGGGSAAFGSHSYVVRAVPGGFRIDSGAPCAISSAPAKNPRCYEQLGGSGGACGNCPAANALLDQKEQVAVLAAEQADRFVIVRARPIDAERVAMERVVLEGPSLFAVVKERIHRVATVAGLSARELDVLEYLLLGRSLDDVGMLLGVSRHTAKFHQANILAKLGADSRFDLIRVLL